MAFLWILERIGFTEKIKLSSSTGILQYAVGRGKENEIKCLSLYVSRKHCKFVQRGENLAIVDLSSANGTYINQTRILAEREIPLQEGDLIGIGVSEITDSDCYVFRLHQNVCQEVDLESDLQKNGNAQVKVIRKRTGELEHVFNPKVPRLENATVHLEASSDLCRTHFDTFSHSVDRQLKKISEELDDTINVKISECKQNSRCDKVCIKTPSEKGVIDMIPKCSKISELDNSRPETVIARAHEPKSVSRSTDATNCECVSVIRTVKNELQSRVDRVLLPPEVSQRSETGPASSHSVHSTPSSFIIISTVEEGRLDSNLSCIERKYGTEPALSNLSDYKTTTSNQTTETESEIPSYSRTHLETINTAIAREDSIEGIICDHYPTVIKKEIGSRDKNLKLTPAVSNCGLNGSEELNTKEVSGVDTKHAPKCSNMKQRSVGYKSSCSDLKGLATDSAKYVSEVSASVDDYITSATATKNGMCIATDDKVIPEASVNIEKDGVDFSYCEKNKSKGSDFSNETSGSKELSAVQKHHSEETSFQIKGPEKKSKKASLKAVSLRNIVSKDESMKHLVECTEEKLKFNEKSGGGSCKSSASLSSQESSTICCKQSKSHVLTGDDKIGTNAKSDFWKDTPLVNSIISSHGDDGGVGEEEEEEEEEEEVTVLSMKHQGVLCGDRKKAKSSIHCVSSHDIPLEPTVKIKQDSGISKQPVVRLEPLPAETPFDDGEQLVTKQKKSQSQRQHILSSTSTEDGELQKNEKKTVSGEQIKVKSNSHLCLPKERKTLPFTPQSSIDDHSKSSNKSNSVSVDGSKALNNRPDMSVQNSVYSMDDDRKKMTTQANKNRVSSPSCMEGMIVDDELFASIQRNKPIVKLERLDDSALKSNGLVVSKPRNESLNYTLDEDIIVVSDDEEYFPSSQIFNEQKMPSESFETKDLDAAPEDLLFHKVVEDDDEDVLVFEDNASDFNDDQWFKRLSQCDLEPELISEMPLQELQSQKEKRNSGSREEFLKDVDVLQVTTDGEKVQKKLVTEDLLETNQAKLKYEETDGEGVQKEIVTEDLLETNQAKLNNEESYNKPKHSVKTLVIDALPLPRRRAFLRGISAEAASQMYNKQMVVSQQQAKSRNTDDDTTSRRGTSSKKKKKKTHVQSSIPDEPCFLTAEQKKQILDERKEKLKAISQKEKAVAAASKQQSMMKVPREVKIKVTNKNRGAFLTEGAETTSYVKAFDRAQSSVLHSDVSSSSNVLKQDSVKSSVPQSKKYESRPSSATARKISDLPRIPKISERPSTSRNGDIGVPSCSAEVVTDAVGDKLPVLTSASSVLSICRTSGPTSFTKRKKNVHFKKDSEMVEMRVIPVEEGSRFKPVAHKKDAPTPRVVFSHQLHQMRPDLDEVLYDILCWNPKWLEEQKSRALGDPPPVQGGKLWPMLSSFVSYKDYLRVLTPLHLLELWASITNETESNPFDPRKTPVVVGIDQVDAVPRLTSSKKPLMQITCHAVLSDYDSQKRLHPYKGDLVYLELELENKDLQNRNNPQPHPSTKQRRIVPIFAYVKHSVKDTIIGTTSVHKKILKPSTRPSTKLILTLQAKFRPYDVKMSHAMRMKVVSNIKSDLRLFQAMAHLPFSSLSNHILKPTEQDFSLPDVTGQQFVPYIKQDQLNESQKRAILKTADACWKLDSKICLIHGPPGTGKSHVIVNLILQILYGPKLYHKHDRCRNVPKILVCAPSNAAVDELVIRLLHVRRTIQKEERFRMVRTGQQETMNPAVKDISIFELAKRDARSNAQIFENMESLNLEIRSLEARQNSLLMTLERARQKNLVDAIAETEFRLSDTELRLAQMRKSKAQNASLDSHQLWRMEREAQSRILLGAHIVATTLSSCFNSQMENIFANHELWDKSGLRFTCCIVDEATQSQEVETLIPLMLGVKTLVLVGDARQLPATVLSKVAKDKGLGKSLFARLETCFEDNVQNPVQLLDVQYRMHPEICLWPNRFFYNGRLLSAPNLTQQRVCPLLPYCVLSLEYKQNICGELSNSGEAELVSQLTLGLLEKLGNQQLSIGIITPYRKQRAMIISILRASSCGSQNVEVNTIDSFQGQERDIIVISCVRTGGVGFLSDNRRLNVALTRARYSLLLCGNFASLQNDNTWHALLENASQRNVLKHVPSGVARNKDELLKLVLRDTQHAQPVV